MILLFRAFLLICAFFLLTYGAFAESPPLSDFTSADKAASFALSQDGKYIALLREEGSSHPYIEIREASTGKRIKRIAHESLRFWNVKWYDDKRLLISASWPEGENTVKARSESGEKQTVLNVNNYGFSRLYTVNFDGSDFTQLFKTDSRLFDRYQHVSTADILDVLKNDPNHLLMTAWQKYELALFKINLRDGDVERIETGDKTTTGWMTNSSGDPIIRFDRYSKGRLVGVSERKSDSKKWTEITRLRDKDLKQFWPLSMTDDPNVLIVSARPDEEDKVAVYKYNIAKKQLGEKIFEHDRYDVESVFFDDDRRPVGYSYISDRQSHFFADAKYANAFAKLKSVVDPDENIHVLDISADQATWLILLTSPENPGTYYYFNATTTKLVKYANRKKNLSREKLGKAEILRFNASDGLELTGYLTKPPGGANGNAPLIVLPHGGPEVRDSYDYDTFVQFLATRGYTVFQPNFRGSGGYGRAFAALGYGEWGGRMQDDITDGVMFLQKTGHIQTTDMCIVGLSYGGYAALMGAIKTPDLYQCAVSINGVSDLPGILKHDRLKFGKKSVLYEYIVKSIGNIQTDSDRLLANSPSSNVDKIKIPILLMHGDDDWIVPVKQSRKLNKALKKAGVDVEYLELPGTNHSLTNFGALAATLYTLEKFLQKELPADN